MDAAARKVLSDCPFSSYKHGTGHGIGLAIHEGPVVSRLSKGVLEEGMVVTIEPGIYEVGRFGIRIEDDVLVTARGAKVLSSQPKDLATLTIG